MLKENWRLIARFERLGDSLIIIACFFTAYYGRDSLKYWNRVYHLGLPFERGGLAPLNDYFTVLLVALLAYGLVLSFLGAYSSMRLSSSLRLLRISFVSSLIVFITLAATLFLLRMDLSRSFIGLFCSLVALTLTAERYVVLELLRFWRRRGRNFRNIIVAGVGDQALKLANEISLRPELGVRIRGFADLSESERKSTQEIKDFRLKLLQDSNTRMGRVISGTAELERALKEYAIDEVIFTDVTEVMPQVESMVIVCSEQGIRTTIAADLFSIGMVKSGLSYFGGMPLIHFQTPPGDRWELALKRSIDVVVAALLLTLLAPFLAMIAALVKLTSPGPIIFAQTRVGLNGRLFQLYKFRSMKSNAEQELPALQNSNEMIGPVFKIADDPRITSFGKFLRRYSLDELPQLWNVFRGDMSLVGPRPPIPGEVSLYERKDRRRLSMRPGMTCTWQVSGRSNIRDFDTWVKLDLEYIDNWSLARDFILLFRTIPAVLFGVGAR